MSLSPFRKLMSLDPSREMVETWCRQQAMAVPAGPRTVLCRVLGDKLMYAHQLDYAIMPHLAMNGIWEPWITMAIAYHVKPGMACLDVGACYGYYSLLLADLVEEKGYVEAWEPVWWETARQNMALNGAPVNVDHRAMGTNVGAELGIRDLPTIHFNAGDVGMYPRSAGHYANRFTSIGAPSPRTYDFIKIDVEGMEMDVFSAIVDKGGILDKSPRLTICMEYTPRQHSAPDDDMRAIQALGFTLGSVGHDGIPRSCTAEEAVKPDTGDFRMLWLTRHP